MATNIKQLLQREDIITMRKDIKELKRNKFFKKIDQPTLKEQPIPSAVLPKQKTVENQSPAPKPIVQKPKVNIDSVAAEKESIKFQQVKPMETQAKKPAESIVLPKDNEILTEETDKPRTPSEVPEKEYLKKIPLAQKEKLKASVKIEEQQRRKFMEDVEKWASSTEENPEDN